MGMHDNLGVFQDAADVIDAAGYSTKFIDIGSLISDGASKALPSDLGVGAHAPMLCIRMATTSGTAADTISIELRQSDTVTADTDAATLNGTVTTVFMPFCTAAGAEVRADNARAITGAWMFRGSLPYEVNQRYIQLYFNNTATTGHFHLDAWLEDGAKSTFRGSQVIVSPVGNP